MNFCGPRPWLSIIIPVYNVAPYLEECLSSVFNQIDDSIEVIALDDVSTDGSRALLEKLRTTSMPRLWTLLHEVNQGPSAARNHMLEVARGEYIWCVDADDILAPGAVAAARRIVRDHAPDLIGCGFQKTPVRRRFRHRFRAPGLRRTFKGPTRCLVTDRNVFVRGNFKSGNMYPWARLFRRAIHPENDLFPVGRFFEDVSSTPKLLFRARSFFYASEAWILYRQRDGSTMHSIDPQKAIDMSLALTALNDDIARTLRSMDLSTRFAVAEFCAKMYIHSCRHLARTDPGLFHRWRARLTGILRQASPLSIQQFMHHATVRPGTWKYAARLLLWRFQPALSSRMHL
ncbi:MAG TPA: glycosyltransferase family 2 protein [Opitutaceae bacterium]|nr:glycosyltransferase family 2 protein [Opitutaceae bacterium]